MQKRSLAYRKAQKLGKFFNFLALHSKLHGDFERFLWLLRHLWQDLNSCGRGLIVSKLEICRFSMILIDNQGPLTFSIIPKTLKIAQICFHCRINIAWRSLYLAFWFAYQLVAVLWSGLATCLDKRGLRRVHHRGFEQISTSFCKTAKDKWIRRNNCCMSLHRYLHRNISIWDRWNSKTWHSGCLHCGQVREHLHFVRIRGLEDSKYRGMKHRDCDRNAEGGQGLTPKLSNGTFLIRLTMQDSTHD